MGLCISKKSEDQNYRNDHNYDCQEVVLFCHGDMNPIDGISSFGSSSLCSRQGNKGVNQDAAVIYQDYGGMENVTFCAVFDGHGPNGHRVSKLVRNRLPGLILTTMKKMEVGKNKKRSSHVDENLSSHCQPSGDQRRWEEAFMSAFRDMEDEIKFPTKIDCSYSGTTAVLVLRQGEDLIIANLGDSRAVLGTMNDDGQITAVQLTTDHKPSVTREKDRIKRSNGRVLALMDEPHNQRVWLPNENKPGLAMSRSFGDLLLKNHGIISIPEVSFHHLTPKDHFLILATDGVWDVIKNDDVVATVTSAYTNTTEAGALINSTNTNTNTNTTAKALVNVSVSKWAEKHPSSNRDDCTALILSLQKKPSSQN